MDPRADKAVEQAVPVEGIHNINEESDDDLFGPDSTPPSAPPQPPTPTETSSPVVERSTTTELAFTTPVLANNHAAHAIYLPWYKSFLPGLANEGYRRQARQNIDAELDRLGDWGIWGYDQTLERRDGDSAGAGEEGEKGRIRERLRIWVRNVQVVGPMN